MSLTGGRDMASREKSETPDLSFPDGIVTQVSPLLVAVGADPTGRPAVSAVPFGLRVGDKVVVMVRGADRLVIATTTPQIPRVFLTGGNITPLAASTVGTMLFPTEVYDTNSLHSTSVNTGRITIPAGLAGLWRFGFSVDFVTFGSGDREAWMDVNGAATRYADQFISHTTGTLGARLSGASDIVVAAGDYVQVRVWQTSSGAMNIGAAGLSQFWASYVGP